MKNALQRAFAKQAAADKAKLEFAAMVAARTQAMQAEKTTAKAAASAPRESIHYRTR